MSLESIKHRHFAEDVQVSKLLLDQLAENQPSLVAEYGEAVAEQRAIRDDLKAKLELKKADTALTYRKTPPDGVKVTEAVIDSLVTTHPEVVELGNQLIEANKELGLLEAAERAIEARGKQIDILTRLHGASYFATPRQGSTDSASAGQPRI